MKRVVMARDGNAAGGLSRRDVLRLLAASSASAGFGPLSVFAKTAWDDTTSWDPFVANITDPDTYIRRKFRQDVTDKATGLDAKAIGALLEEIVAAGRASGESWRIAKAKCFAAQAMKMSIDVSPLDWYPAISIWDRKVLPIRNVISERKDAVNKKLIPEAVMREWQEGNRNRDWMMWQDFDHSVPDWRVILKLGFPGLKERLMRVAHEKKVERVGGGGERTFEDPFYEGLRISIDAALGCIDRFIAQAEKKVEVLSRSRRMEDDVLSPTSTPDFDSTRLTKEIACLKRLRTGAPETAYDMLMFVWLYYFFSEHLDGIQCRSLTEIDVFLTPYYERDLALGRTTEAEFREQFKHWLWQWGSIWNYWNQPVGLGGTKADGTSEYNHVTKIILEVMDECALATPKFLVKVAPNTPDWAMDKMMDMARRHRSIAFIGEEPYAKMLRKWTGASDPDCREMVVKGCYEVGLRDGANSSCAGHVNFLTPVERMLAEAKVEAGSRSRREEFRSPSTWTLNFDSFKAEYLRRLADVTTRCRKVAEWTEKALPEVNPANMMTLSTENALKTRKDGYANGCPRGNNSTLLAVGPGTAVDALLAIKEIVYEKKEMSLAELGQVMAANWEGHEALRMRMLRSKRKWGNNDPEANALGGELLRTFAAQVNGFPNVRGGKFLASGHCAKQYIDQARGMGATPDGRKAGDEMSKNLSATMGADTEGATALVMTLANSGTTVCDLPGDCPLDVMMHPSACEGERGIAAMKTIVRLFHRNGGGVVQFTVFSAEELRDAQAHPGKYENLQIRVCGWNVRWNDMTKREQDAYIRRAECIMR